MLGDEVRVLSSLMRRWVAVLLVSAVTSCGDGGGAASTGTVMPAPQWVPSDVAKACVMALSCVSPTLTSSAGYCSYQLERTVVAADMDPALMGFAACTKTAASCTDALACASLNHGPDYCAAHPGSSCDGDLVIDCFPLTMPHWTVTIPPTDCRALGMTCLDGICTDGKTCHDIITSQCIGTTIRGCEQSTGIEYATDCRLLYPDGVCDVSLGRPECAPPKGGFCSSPNSGPWSICQGDVLMDCQDLLETKVDCTKFASHCALDGDLADCVSDANDCTPTSPDRCNGAALEFCQDGRYRDFDCASVGLGPCGTLAAGGVACGAGT